MLSKEQRAKVEADAVSLANYFEVHRVSDSLGFVYDLLESYSDEMRRMLMRHNRIRYISEIRDYVSNLMIDPIAEDFNDIFPE